MARRVAAELTLDAKQYLAEAKVVEQRTAAVDHEMDQLDRSIDKVDRDAAELAASAAVAARQVDNLGDQAGGTARALTLLDARIKAMRLSVHALGEEWGRSGERADQVAFNAEKRALAALERLRRTLVPDAGGSKVYRSANALAPKVTDLGIGGEGIRNPYVIGAILTAISAAGPALAAMLGGIIAGAIGTVGVAGGLLSASKDPHVLAAAGDFGDAIAAEFFRGGKAFVGPAIESLDILEQAFLDLKVPEALGQVSDDVTTIARGFADAGTRFMPGFNVALSRMGPFADAAADGMGLLGESLGTFIDDVTSSPGAVMGLRAAFDLLGGTVVFLGKEIKFLEDAFGGLVVLGAKVGQNPLVKFLSLGASNDPSAMMQRWVDAFDRERDAVSAADHAVQSFGQSVDRATEEQKIFNDALSESYSGFLDFTGAEIGAEQAVDDLAKSFAEHGRTLDVTTEAGRDNLRNLKDLAEAATEAARKKLIETHSVEDANAVYQHYREELFEVARQAGFTAEQAQALVDKWLAMKTLEDVKLFVSIDVDAVVRYTLGPIPKPFGAGFQEFAAGGTTPAFEPFKVGERGPEWMFASREHFVATAGQVAAAGAGDVNVNVDVSLDGQAIEPRMVKIVTDHDRDTQRRVLAGARR